MISGERRFARRLESHLEDDYVCWYYVPVGATVLRLLAAAGNGVQISAGFGNRDLESIRYQARISGIVQMRKVGGRDTAACI
jgi:hypothetical protein